MACIAEDREGGRDAEERKGSEGSGSSSSGYDDDGFDAEQLVESAVAKWRNAAEEWKAAARKWETAARFLELSVAERRADDDAWFQCHGTTRPAAAPAAATPAAARGSGSVAVTLLRPSWSALLFARRVPGLQCGVQ